MVESYIIYISLEQAWNFCSVQDYRELRIWTDKEEGDTSFNTLCQNSPGGREDEGGSCVAYFTTLSVCLSLIGRMEGGIENNELKGFGNKRL
jgi:hypothetical protein